MKNKLVFISSIASPYQVKFCHELQNYFDAEFWFHDYTGSSRPNWWKIPLGPKCKIFHKVILRNGKFLALDLIYELKRFDPDILVLGGFWYPSNILAYLWAKLKKKKTIVFTEISRNRQNKIRVKGLYTRFTKLLYNNVDAVFTSALEATIQHQVEFGFANRVYTTQYPSDIDEHLQHPLRIKEDSFVLLFANRLTSIYDPLLAIEIFATLYRKYPKIKMLINAFGELHDECQTRIATLGLTSQITFLDAIGSWDDLHKVYLKSDILLLPANFSAGNFTIVESMASGLGIVVSNKIIGIGIDDLKIFQSGFICEPQKDDFVCAISKYVDNPELLKIHGSLNKNFVKKYSIAETAKLWSGLISEVFPEQQR